MVISPQKTWGIHWIHWVWGMKATDLGMVGVEGKGMRVVPEKLQPQPSSNWAETARLGYVTNFQQFPTQISLFLPMRYPKFHQNEWITSSKKYDNPCLASNNRYSPKIQNKKSTKKRLYGFNVGFHSLLTSINSLLQMTSFKGACFSPV